MACEFPVAMKAKLMLIAELLYTVYFTFTYLLAVTLRTTWLGAYRISYRALLTIANISKYVDPCEFVILVRKNTLAAGE